MGTVFSLDVRDPGVEATAIDAVVDLLHRLDAQFSPYRADSETCRYRRGEVAAADISPELAWVRAEGQRLAERTGGYFSLWPGGDFDPSGLVKGWAVEQASDLLVAAGSANHSLNGGGDVQCVGRAAPDRPWRVGVADPSRPGELVAVVTGADLAVATSGSAERGAHIIDPHTGRAAAGSVSVTVVGTRLAVVDAYATAAFAMGGRGFGWLAAQPDCQALVVGADGRRRATDGFPTGKAQHEHTPPRTATGILGW